MSKNKKYILSIKNKKTNYVSLQAHTSFQNNKIWAYFFACLKNKRKYKYNAGITLEGGIVISICIFVFALFMQFYIIIQANVYMDTVVKEVLLEIGNERYISKNISEKAIEKLNTEDISKNKLIDLTKTIITEEYIEYKTKKKMAQRNTNNIIKNVSVKGSKINDDDNAIIIVASYNVNLLFLGSGMYNFNMTSKAEGNMFLGRNIKDSSKDENDTDNIYVYITETGHVYHTSINCTHLKLSIKEVEYRNISSLRNNNGGKYYPCSECKNFNENVYITSEGNKYHSNIKCSGLKRTIKKVKLSTIPEYKQCLRCKG